MQRQPRVTSAGAAAQSAGEKRLRFVKEAADSPRSDELKRIGLRKVVAWEQVPDAQNAFQRLAYMGAYVVDTDDMQMAERAVQILNDDYLIVPNMQLGLPTPQLTQRFQRRPYRSAYWPDITGISEAHAGGAKGAGVMVGVLDTGVDADHVELRRKRIDFRYVPLNPSYNKVRECRGFDVDGHGTHVSGIIAGKSVGLAPDVDLMVASVIESETLKTSLERIVVALDWMLSHFQRDENLEKTTIINMSLGFLPHWLTGTEAETVMNGIRIIISTLVADFDVLPVVAIGNDGPGMMRAPGFFPETLSVGAVDDSLNPAPFSGGGLSTITGDPEPNIAGLGVDVLSSLERTVDRRSLYAKMSGTSMAAPYVTGIAALYASADSTLSGAALRQKLIGSALPLPWPANRVGAGLARFVP
jgi:subtilisin family serine protease